jgi:hypothetical protein
MNYSPISLAIVIDANTALRAVMPIRQDREVKILREWHQNSWDDPKHTMDFIWHWQRV